MEIGNNIKKEFSFFDKSINKKNSKCYKLFAYYDNHSFSYSMFNIEKKEFTSLNSYVFNDESIQNIENIIKDDSTFKWALNSLNINCFLKRCTLVPTALFDENIKEKYLEFNNFLENSEEILVDKLKHINSVVIYSIPKSHLNFLKKINHINIKHSATTFLENILDKTKHSNENEIFLEVSTKNFHVGVIQSSKLIFYNNFPFNTKNDFLYYILNCYNTLNLNSKNTTLNISGEFEKKSILNNLEKYIKKVIILSRNSGESYIHLFNSIPNHYFHKLFNQLKCE